MHFQSQYPMRVQGTYMQYKLTCTKKRLSMPTFGTSTPTSWNPRKSKIRVPWGQWQCSCLVSASKQKLSGGSSYPCHSQRRGFPCGKLWRIEACEHRKLPFWITHTNWTCKCNANSFSANPQRMALAIVKKKTMFSILKKRFQSGI